MSAQDPTADYRKYSKGPNFLLVVLGFCVTILLVIIATMVFLKRDATKSVPHGPNPTPNSLVRPLLPASIPHIA